MHSELVMSCIVQRLQCIHHTLGFIDSRQPCSLAFDPHPSNEDSVLLVAMGTWGHEENQDTNLVSNILPLRDLEPFTRA